jgi:hypothetical protein
MTDHDQTETETPVEMLLRENGIFKNWVLGLLEGCEGCRKQATQWSEAFAAAHEAADANGEVRDGS